MIDPQTPDARLRSADRPTTTTAVQSLPGGPFAPAGLPLQVDPHTTRVAVVQSTPDYVATIGQVASQNLKDRSGHLRNLRRFERYFWGGLLLAGFAAIVLSGIGIGLILVNGIAVGVVSSSVGVLSGVGTLPCRRAQTKLLHRIDAEQKVLDAMADKYVAYTALLRLPPGRSRDKKIEKMARKLAAHAVT